MKSIHEQIEVDVRPGGRVPRRFRWERRTYRVRRLLDYWILQTRWWGREEKRIYYRLETNRGIVEIYCAAEIIRLAARFYTGEAPRSASVQHPPIGGTNSASDVAVSASEMLVSASGMPVSTSEMSNSASDTLRFASDGADSAAARRTPSNTPRHRSTEAFARPAHRPAGAAPDLLPDPRTDRPPLPIEGDTHTRERRRTDAAYRPDVRIEERARRQAAAQKASGTEHRVRWVLSKILD